MVTLLLIQTSKWFHITKPKTNDTLINLFFHHFGFLFCLIGVKKPERDYNIQGSSINKLFTITGAAANLVFAFNTGMLPEIQVSLIDCIMVDRNLCLFFDTNICAMIRLQWSSRWLETWWRLCIFNSLLVFYQCMPLHSSVIGLTGRRQRLIC